jgi:hypothetical protein
MSRRQVDTFFYGLFMDIAILRESRVLPVNPRRAYVEGFALRIGQRASLSPWPEQRVYGMLFALTHSELQALYSAPGLDQYRPEAVLARGVDGGLWPALCYNLPEAPRPDESNPEYAARLQAALRKLAFPSEYVSSIS